MIFNLHLESLAHRFVYNYTLCIATTFN